MIRLSTSDLAADESCRPDYPARYACVPVAFLLGLTDKPSFSLSAARCITEALAEVFPGDPCLGDFALFGYGVNHPELTDNLP